MHRGVAHPLSVTGLAVLLVVSVCAFTLSGSLSLILVATVTTLPIALALADRKSAFVRRAALAAEALSASSPRRACWRI